MEDIYINNTQITQVGAQEAEGRARQSVFYDSQKRLIFSKSIYARKHVTTFVSTSKQSDTIYTIAGRDPATIGHLFLLFENIDTNNMIMKVNQKTKRAKPAASKEDLYEIMGYSSRTAGRKLMKILEDKGVIVELIIKSKNSTTGKEESYKRYHIGPIYTMQYKGLPLDTYKLFKESVDKLLSNKEKLELEKILWLDQYDESVKSDTQFIKELTKEWEQKKQKEEAEKAAQEENDFEESITRMIDNVDNEDIFNKYILKGQPAKTYQPVSYTKDGEIKVKYEALPLSEDNDTYFSVNKTDDYLQYKPAKDKIVGFNTWFLDIDAGRDDNKKYLSIEEVARRKAEMMKVINLLPPVTAIVDTRNGYHAYWACKGLDTKEDEQVWQDLQMKLHDIVMIADNSARKDCSRIMRLPGSVWNKTKEGLEPYNVTILKAAEIDYTADDFAKMLNACQSKVQDIAKEYISIYPDVAKTTTGKSAAAPAIIEEQSKRIQAIAALSTDTFVIPIDQATVGSVNKELKKQDLADFLQIKNPDSFCCVLHVDHNPSATIYDNETGYRYYCPVDSCIGHGGDDGKGLDIIDVVMKLANCSYKEAIKYLCRIYNINNQSVA